MNPFFIANIFSNFSSLTQRKNEIITKENTLCAAEVSLVLTSITGWVYIVRGKKMICRDHGLPEEVRDKEDEVYLDEGVNILRQMSLKDKIEMESVKIEVQTRDVYGNSVVFKASSMASFKRILEKFPSIRQFL